MDIPQLIALFIALLCLLISGFISGSEIAFFSLTDSQAEELEDSRRGQATLALLRKPERLLATVLIANNLVNVTIVVLTNFALGPIFNDMAPWLSFVLQTVILTFLILLFGEIAPKLFANANPMRFAVMATPGMTAFSKIFSPLSRMLVGSSSFVKHVVTKQTPNISTDELSQALQITDVETPGDKQMLEGILRFGDTTASEIMTPRIDITDIDITESFDKVMHIIIDSGFSRLPVYEDTEDNIRGILYSRDLLPYIGESPDPAFAWQKLLREPYFVPESRQIDDLLEDFRRRRIHMAIVVDEFGGTQGIVTMEDVLEEIVGDINDEYDEDEKTYRQLREGTYEFEGKTLLTDFFRITGLDSDNFEDVAADAETLAGMLLAIKGDFPKEKEPLVYGRCRFMVIDMEAHRIKLVRVKILPEDTPE